jgi:hypothetical protein
VLLLKRRYGSSSLSFVIPAKAGIQAYFWPTEPRFPRARE